MILKRIKNTTDHIYITSTYKRKNHQSNKNGGTYTYFNS